MNISPNPTPQDSMDDQAVEETMARFQASLARITADPDEAARIRALALRTEFELLTGADPFKEPPGEEMLLADLHAPDMTDSGSPLRETLDATTARLEELIRETQPRVQQRLLEAERTAYRAELDLVMAGERAAVIIKDAERHADLRQQEAALRARQMELQVLSEKLHSDQRELDKERKKISDREKERKASSGGSRQSWLIRMSLNPALTLPMTAVIGAFIAIQSHVLSVALTFAIAAAFNMITYAVAILMSARGLNRQRGGAEAALRLLLGPFSREETARALPTARKVSKRGKDVTRQNPAAPSSNVADFLPASGMISRESGR